MNERRKGVVLFCCREPNDDQKMRQTFLLTTDKTKNYLLTNLFTDSPTRTHMNSHAAKTRRAKAASVFTVRSNRSSAIVVLYDFSYSNMSHLLPHPIMEHASNGDLERVQNCVNRYRVEVDGQYGRAALYFASKGHLRVVRWLVEQGTDVNGINQGWLVPDGLTPLHAASYFGQHAIVQYLVEHGANIDALNTDGASPIFLACQNHHFPVVQYLVEHGANTNTMLLNRGGTPLLMAAEDGILPIVKCLVENGANVNTPNDDQVTPLLLAVGHDHLSVAQCLIEKGANVNVRNSMEHTPLHLATGKGHFSTARYLVEHAGADVNACDQNGAMPLHYAVQFAVRYAEEFGTDSDSLCPLVKCLVEHGANVNAREQQGFASLHAASALGHLSSVECLVQHGAHVNITDDANCTPLHRAISNAHLSVVQYLLRSGANVNAPDRDRLTPLHWASSEGLISIVECLVRNGADINLESERGLTPLDVAMDCGNEEVVEYLESMAHIHQCHSFVRYLLQRGFWNSQQKGQKRGLH